MLEPAQLRFVAFTILLQVVSIWLPFMQVGYNCCSLAAKAESGIVTHWAVAFRELKIKNDRLRMIKNEILFLMLLGFKNCTTKKTINV